LFHKGSTLVQGSEKAKATLKTWGWSGAGLDPTKAPIWVVVEQKEEKKDDKKC